MVEVNQIKIETKLNKSGNTRGMSPNSRANLRNDASPGRPHKADCLLDCIKEELAKLSPNGISTNEQLVAAALVSKATRGDTKATELMLSYLHARPSQGIDLGSKTDNPLRILYELVDGG